MYNIKPLANEEVCNATPKTFGGGYVRLVNTSTGLRTITVKDVKQVVNVTVNTDVNATTLFVLTTGNTLILKSGDLIVNSSNTGVVNTDVSSRIDAIINSTAFTSNVDVLIANGTADVSIGTLISNTTMLGNSVLFIVKSKHSTLHSNNNTDVLAQPIALKGF